MICSYFLFTVEIIYRGAQCTRFLFLVGTRASIVGARSLTPQGIRSIEKKIKNSVPVQIQMYNGLSKNRVDLKILFKILNNIGTVTLILINLLAIIFLTTVRISKILTYNVANITQYNINYYIELFKLCVFTMILICTVNCYYLFHK